MTDRRRSIRTALVACVASVTMTAGTLAAAVTLAPPAHAQLAALEYQAEAFTVTNVQRLQHARVPLRHHACVQKWAVRQARKMARQERMFHQDLARVAKDCHLSLAGENVAYGYPTGRSVVLDGWMKSTGHRANILKRGYRLMGIGARRAGGTWYVAQVFGRKAR
ncbi:CAP domain-containing protein [Nocardioides sp.]|uniref:CAP domain-containing protein n=1 Tax=Nocardioides sp. TaxID=35761 RepID=UPI00262C0A93|nr:CAP domain-containing protein [Nocardioides sp.]MDI6910832.1 CAP domain-containing protein [Nocardioides sp.]